METFLNRTQAARALSIAPQTLRQRIRIGTLTPDAKSSQGHDLFSQKSIEAHLAANRADLKRGDKMPKGKK